MPPVPARTGVITNTENDMTRYRIQNSNGNCWNSDTDKWESTLIGYNTYRTEGQAMSAARRIKNDRFTNEPNKMVVEDSR